MQRIVLGCVITAAGLCAADNCQITVSEECCDQGETQSTACYRLGQLYLCEPQKPRNDAFLTVESVPSGWDILTIQASGIETKCHWIKATCNPLLTPPCEWNQPYQEFYCVDQVEPEIEFDCGV